MPPSYPAGSYPAQVVADGAVAYWRLGETSGTTAVDVIAGANGTIAGGVTLGQAGALADGDKAMGFNGTTGKIDTGWSLTLPTNFSIETWIKTTYTGGQRAIFSNFGAGTPVGTVYLGIADSKVFFYVVGGNPAAFAGTIALVDNQYHHLVLVVTPSQTVCYLDGNVTDTLGQTKPAYAASLVTIGYWGSEFFPGNLDEVAIYPTALTAPQIAAHYAARTWKAFGPAFQDMRYRWCRYVAGQVRR